MQDARAPIPTYQVRSRGGALGNSPGDEQRRGTPAWLVFTFEQFTKEVYLPFCRRSWKESTAGTSEQIIGSHLVPEFGASLLHSIRREELQDFLDRKALNLSESVVSHLRWFLNGIFKLAQSDGLVLSNPAAELRIPKKCQPGRAMRPLTEEEVAIYLELFSLREKLIARLAIFEGLRPGEILALRWKALAGDILRVKERVYKRVFDTPKNGKKREGGISDGTLNLLREWAELAQDPSPDGFVFPSENLRTPLSPDNLWRRHMQPKLKTIGMEWATFQVLRKTNASLSQKAGVDPKVSSGQRGPRARGQHGGLYEFGHRSRSEQQSENSRELCFENHAWKAGLLKQSRLNGINGITTDQCSFPSC